MSDPVPEPRPDPTPAAAASDAGAGDGSPEAQARKKRRRGSRGGRGKKPTADASLPTTSSDPTNDADVDLVKPKIGDTRPARVIPPPPGPRRAAQPVSAVAEAGGGDGDGPSKKKRRRGGRGKGAGAGGGGNGGGGNGGSRSNGAAIRAGVSLDDDLGDPIELDEETLERRRGKERNGRPLGRYLMAVHVRANATQIGVLEGRSLIEHYVSRPTDDTTQIDGNIYLARVQNVLPGMEAAFVDIGTPKNAVLYRGDVRYDAEDVESGSTKPNQNMKIEQMLKSGQTILCQVTKNPIAHKGARLTQEVSLPGRFVVLIPNSDTYGISKRLSDDERKRLRRILDAVKPAQHGVIVRTAAEGTTEDELRRDVLRLLKQWEQIEALAARSKAPALLYKEPDLAVRVIREEFNKEYRGVVIDDPALYEEVKEYVESITPELADRVELYDESTDGLPIFERFHVHEQLHKALDRKVWLPSGGSLIIERTEALTVIDVNTGKNVGTTNLEETVFRNNLEAAAEVARQLRLRDVGGIIVIDFIDMEIRENRNKVITAFRDALARDKTRTQVFDISELGLVEMTRKRVSEGLVESFSETCPTCGGRGLIMDESLL
jgi:ribonuclease E